MNDQIKVVLPADVAEIAKNVSVEKRNEVQDVLNHVFNGVSKMREQLDSVTVSDENDKVNMKLANTIRLGVRQVRLDAEKTFDAKRAEVQQLMLGYKTEDSLWLKAKQTMQILTREIEENARWKEETRERFEAEQKEIVIQQRINRVAKVAELTRSEFENMSDTSFELFATGLEKAYAEKIEAEKKAEAERIAKEKADAEERLRIQAENERLKKEAEAKELQLAKERENAEKQRKEIEAKAEAERKAIEEKARKEREEQQRIIEKQREEAAKIEKERLAKEAEAENQRKAAELAAKKLAAAPDKEKLLLFAAQLRSMQLPVLSSIEAINIVDNIKVLIEKTALFTDQKANEL